MIFDGGERSCYPTVPNGTAPYRGSRSLELPRPSTQLHAASKGGSGAGGENRQGLACRTSGGTASGAGAEGDFAEGEVACAEGPARSDNRKVQRRVNLVGWSCSFRSDIRPLLASICSLASMDAPRLGDAPTRASVARGSTDCRMVCRAAAPAFVVLPILVLSGRALLLVGSASLGT